PVLPHSGELCVRGSRRQAGPRSALRLPDARRSRLVVAPRRTDSVVDLQARKQSGGGCRNRRTSVQAYDGLTVRGAANGISFARGGVPREAACYVEAAEVRCSCRAIEPRWREWPCVRISL